MFINGDCVEEMAAIPEKTIQLVVTSPPYRANKEYEGDTGLEEYTKWAKEWIGQIPRLLSDNGGFWLNVGYTKLSNTETLPLTYLYYPLIRDAGLHLIQEIVWHFEGGMSYKHRFTHRTERWMWFVKNPSDYIFNLDAVRDINLNRTKDKRNNPLGKNPTDYWYFDRVVGGTGKSNEKLDHPCQFPEKMIERIIRSCSNQNDTVLDCFGGVGSTASVANKLTRKFISIERDLKYHEQAIGRINIHNQNHRENSEENGSLFSFGPQV